MNGYLSHRIISKTRITDDEPSELYTGALIQESSQKNINVRRVIIENQRERGHWAIYYTRPQSNILTFTYSLAQQLWGLLLNFDWLFHLVSVQTV